MNDDFLNGLLADAVLISHIAVAAFVLGGTVLVIVGNFRHWRWVNGVRFRLAHLAAIVIIVAETWFGIPCPLTTMEMQLRSQVREGTYSKGFIEYWLHRLLYFDAPPWVFFLAYSMFGSLVVAMWWYFPPGRMRPGKDAEDNRLNRPAACFLRAAKCRK